VSTIVLLNVAEGNKNKPVIWFICFRKRSYTDTANFTLRCGVCQIGVIGQKVIALSP